MLPNCKALVWSRQLESGKEGVLDEATIKGNHGRRHHLGALLVPEFFDFKPAFKLWLATTHRPSIRGTDDAIWRRIRLIPFTRQSGPKL